MHATDDEVTNEFLEESQYSRTSILENEVLFGHNYYSTGGEEELARMCRHLGDRRFPRVLDIGAGLGGAAFWFARRDPSCIVDGLELLESMHTLSLERLAEQDDLAGRVRLLRGDVLRFTPEAPYDLIYSNSVFLHIRDKSALLRRLATLLAPGGSVLFGDYCIGVPGPETIAYANLFRYHMITFEAWTSLLRAHDFSLLHASDDTEQFLRYSLRDLERPGLSALFREVLPRRIGRIERGEHRWCVFHCTR